MAAKPVSLGADQSTLAIRFADKRLMLTDIAFRIVSRLMNLTPMCDTLTIERHFAEYLRILADHYETCGTLQKSDERSEICCG